LQARFTVLAVWDNFQALCCHFERTSQDDQRDGKERSMFLGMLNRIRSPEFLFDLGVMYDALYKLSSLSELLQNRSTSLVQADKYMRRTIRVLQSMKEKSGTRSLEAKSAATHLQFKTSRPSSWPQIRSSSLYIKTVFNKFDKQHEFSLVLH